MPRLLYKNPLAELIMPDTPKTEAKETIIIMLGRTKGILTMLKRAFLKKKSALWRAKAKTDPVIDEKHADQKPIAMELPTIDLA